MTTLEPPDEARGFKYRGDAVSEVMNRAVAAGGDAYEISSDVVEYILDEVLVGDDEWMASHRAGRIKTAQVETILFEAMDEAMQIARQRGQFHVDADIAREAFPRVVEQRFDCPYPFLIC